MKTIIGVLVVILMGVAVRAEGQRELWFYYSTNLLVDQNITKLEPIWRRAAAAGYTKVMLADSKLAQLGEMPAKYFRNLARVKKIAEQLHLEIVPAVCPMGHSNGLLANDPNLAEGLPVKDSLFVVHGDVAKLVPDPEVKLGERPDWADDSVRIDGGVATVVNNPGNARMAFKLTVAPFRCYHVSVKVRTDGYDGEPKIVVLDNGEGLQYQHLGVRATEDWTEHDVVFDSLAHNSVTVYLGVWGEATGRLEWKDWKIEEVGLLNVLRREGTPLKVAGLTEGKDFDQVKDARMGVVPWPGEYEVYHEPPVVHTHGVAEGTKLRVSWYFPPVIFDEQVSACLMDPKVLVLMEDEVKRVKSALNPQGFMLSHDELRCANWDETCQEEHMTAGDLLAENVRACVGMLGEAKAYVWSDMFDPFHNAKDHYFLVRGDLAGSWKGLDPAVTVVNWNFERRDQSLKFFAEQGHEQVIAGYYDGRMEQVDQWLASAEKVKGVVGVMYTTWRHDYENLEAFARRVREKQ